jgi:hypothetical protein
MCNKPNSLIPLIRIRLKITDIIVRNISGLSASLSIGSGLSRRLNLRRKASAEIQKIGFDQNSFG